MQLQLRASTRLVETMTVIDSFSLESGKDEMFGEYAALYNAVNSFDCPDHVYFSSDFFRSAFSSTQVDLTKNVILVRNLRRELVASGTIYPQNTSPPRLNIMVRVHPEYRRQGIGTMVLKHIEQNASDRGVNLLYCRVPSYRQYSISFLSNQGYEKDLTWIKMHIDHRKPIEPIVLHWGFRVRGLHAKKELSLWAQLQNEIFVDDPSYEPVDVNGLRDMISHRAFDPNLFLVGILNDTPVGLCNGWPINEGKEMKVQIQGMGVVNEHRRKGYGKELLVELLNRAYLKGYSSSELVVQSTNAAALSLYKMSGFTEKYRYYWFKKLL